MTEASPHAPDWYPDPMGRHEFRWFDGNGWTDRVSSHGKLSTDSMDVAAKQVVAKPNNAKVQKQVDKHIQQATKRGAPTESMLSVSGALLDQPILVINQKTKLLEINTEYAIFDGEGTQIGMVRQVGQSKLKKLFRFIGSWDQFLTHKYQLVDGNGVVQIGLTRPAKFFKSRVIVSDQLGVQVGEIVQKNMFGKIKFDFLVNGEPIGSMNAENWRAWNFSLQDTNGTEVGRITKTFEGLLKTAFTSADNYVLQVNQALPDPLRLMVYASAIAVDTALKQDDRGLGSGSVLDIFGN